jgi:hypothetical protein
LTARHTETRTIKEIACPHLHIYRAGYGDKWAVPAPADKYPDVQDLFSTFEASCATATLRSRLRSPEGFFLERCRDRKITQDYRDWLRDRTTMHELNGSWAEITTPPENFPLRKHNLVQAMLAAHARNRFIIHQCMDRHPADPLCGFKSVCRSI